MTEDSIKRLLEIIEEDKIPPVLKLPRVYVNTKQIENSPLWDKIKWRASSERLGFHFVEFNSRASAKLFYVSIHELNLISFTDFY